MSHLAYVRINRNINPYLTNEFSHHYQLDESTFIFRGVRWEFSHFSIKFLYANRIAPDGTPHSAASNLRLFCLSMSHKKDTRLLCVQKKLSKLDYR